MLGALEVRARSGDVLEIGGSRLRALLIMLALRPGLVWLRRLAEDQDNMHAAVRGAVAAGDARTAVRLAAALGWYWSLRSLKVEGDFTFGHGVQVIGDVELESGAAQRIPADTVLDG